MLSIKRFFININFKNNIEKNPPLFLVFGFLFIILLGSVLLFLPISSSDGRMINYLDALFTATSAVCVTGLSTLTISHDFNLFGQIVILCLIEIGALGFMTMATIVSLIFGKRITLRNRLVIQEQMGESKLSGMVKLVKYVIFSTLLIELIGIILLSFYFVPKYGNIGFFYAVFHTISAFCNAGFDILGNSSLSVLNHAIYPIMILSFLIILGGLGFNVYMDINANKLSFRKYSLHTKIVLVTSIGLLVLGTLLFFILERHNTFLDMSFSERWVNAFFQSVTTRTAGFYTVNQKEMTDASSVFTIFLMFVGGSPASTAGGIKTVSFFLLIMTTISLIKGDEEIEVFQRRIDFKYVKRSIGILVISLFLISIFTFLLILIEHNKFPFLTILFEVVSAFATVGLSRDITPLLEPFSKILLIILMFIGRVGSLTIIFALFNKVKTKKFKYSYGKVIVG